MPVIHLYDTNEVVGYLDGTETVLVGPTYRLDQFRSRSDNTITLEVTEKGVITIPSPVTGPVLLGSVQGKYHAGCVRCRQGSKLYKAKRSLPLRQWAYQHRCEDFDREANRSIVREFFNKGLEGQSHAF